MTLDSEKIRECFWLFSYTLPIYSEANQAAMKGAVGADLGQIVPDVLQVIAQMCMKNPDDLEGYLNFFHESWLYCKGERKSLPEVAEGDPEEIKKLMYVQLGKYRDYKEELKKKKELEQI